MTPDELMKALGDSNIRVANAAQEVVAFARLAVHSLRDAGAKSVADELERRLHMHDCEVQESAKLMNPENAPAFIELMRKRGAERDPQ